MLNYDYDLFRRHELSTYGSLSYIFYMSCLLYSMYGVFKIFQ